MRRWLLLLPVLLGMAGIKTTVSAQEATPASGFTVADPALCQVEPRSMADLTTFVATPEPGYTPPTPIDPPAGQAADDETTADARATAIELYACFNANDYLRAFSLFTDNALARGFLEGGYTEEMIEGFGAPATPLPEEHWWSVDLEEITVLEDGRVGAIVVEHNPQAKGDFRIYMILAEQDGRYLIDDSLQLATD